MSQYFKILNNFLSELEAQIKAEPQYLYHADVTKVVWRKTKLEALSKEELEDKCEKEERKVGRLRAFFSSGEDAPIPDGMKRVVEKELELNLSYNEEGARFRRYLSVEATFNSHHVEVAKTLSYGELLHPTTFRARRIISRYYNMYKDREMRKIDQAVELINGNRIENILMGDKDGQEK